MDRLLRKFCTFSLCRIIPEQHKQTCNDNSLMINLQTLILFTFTITKVPIYIREICHHSSSFRLMCIIYVIYLLKRIVVQSRYYHFSIASIEHLFNLNLYYRSLGNIENYSSSHSLNTIGSSLSSISIKYFTTLLLYVYHNSVELSLSILI